MTEAFIGLVSGLVGAGVGFFGAFYLERRRETMRARAQILAVLLEMNLLEDTITQAIEQSIRLRHKLRCEAWRSHGTDLANWLPWHLMRALHLHYHLFDNARELYRRLATSLTTGRDLEDMHVTLWTFVYWSQSLRARIVDVVANLQKSFWLRAIGKPSAGKKDQELFESLVTQIQGEAFQFVRSKGLEPRPIHPAPGLDHEER